MKRILPAVLLLLALLASCTQRIDPSATTATTDVTSAGTVASSDQQDEQNPTTTPSVTTLPPVTQPIPVFGDVDLTDVDRDSRTVVYTAEKTVLYRPNGGIYAEIEEGKTLIELIRTDEYAVILYKDVLCLTYPHLLTGEVPASAKELMDRLGGIYYPGGDLLVAIDAGHQGKAMKEKEPLGPGSTQLKAMVSSGTQGVSTRIPERELNLQVSLLLRDELLSRGYSVLMIRETQEVTISNAQRAKVANAYEADAFIRIHANGSDDRSVRGAMTICQTPENPYNGSLYARSRRLSDCILDQYCIATDIQKNNVWETDTMTGINWAQTPVTIVEMGYMSNPEEDELMATDAFRRSAAIGMANGLDAYFATE